MSCQPKTIDEISSSVLIVVQGSQNVDKMHRVLFTSRLVVNNIVYGYLYAGKQKLTIIGE